MATTILEKTVRLNKVFADGTKEIYYPVTKDENVMVGETQTLDEKLSSVDTSITNLKKEATTSAAGLMSASDKSKLNGIAANANNYSHPTSSGYKHIPSGGSSGQILRWSAEGTAVWGADNDTKYSVFGAATSSAAGSNGLVPAPSAGAQAKFLRADGTWQTPTNTTYSVFTGATSSAAGSNGLVPAPAKGDNSSKYLKADGTWATPPNTTYNVATQSANGLMSSTDKTKLDGIATGANKTVVDSALSSTSTNPVQNKVVNTAITNLTTRLDNLIADAPEAYDTLKEISDYIASHTTEYEALLAITGNKVDKVSGKGLSTNDYTTAEKNKLAGIADNANNYTHPTSSGNKHIPSGGSSGQILRWSADGTAVWGADRDTTYSVATQSANGLMSSTDKTRVDNMYAKIQGYSVTSGTSSAYTVTIAGATLTEGTMILVRFNVANAANATLDVNGLGSKPIYYRGAAISSNRAPANSVIALVYDTTQVTSGAWHYVYSYDSTYSNATLGHGYGTCTTAEATTAKTAGLNSYSLSTGGSVSIKFTYNVPASSTLNINGKGAKNIFYRGAAITAGVIKAGDIATFVYDGTQYQLISRDRDDNTTYSNATTSTAGLMSATDKSKLDGIATNANNYTHPTSSGNKHIPSGGSSGQILRWSADGTAVWGADNDTKYTVFKGASASANGSTGLVPAPTSGNQGKYLRADGTWQTPTNTTYNVATQSANGLMSSTDKKRMDKLPDIVVSDTEPSVTVDTLWFEVLDSVTVS